MIYCRLSKKSISNIKDYPDILTPNELAIILRIGKNATYALLHDDIIRHKRNGKKYLIPKKNVIDYLASP